MNGVSAVAKKRVFSKIKKLKHTVQSGREGQGPGDREVPEAPYI